MKWFAFSVSFLSLLFYGLTCSAQDSLILALKKQAGTSADKDRQMISCSKLAALLRLTDSTGSKNYAKTALSLSQQSKNYSARSEVWKNLYKYYRTNAPSLKLQAVDSCLYYAQKSRDTKTLGNAFYLQGYNEDDANEENAVNIYFKALDYLQKANADKEMAVVCYRITGVYGMTQNFDNEEKYAKLAKYHAEKSNNPDALCVAYLALSSHYIHLFEKDKKQRTYLDSCVFYLKKCLSIFETNEPYCEERFVPETAALNLANWYYLYYPKAEMKDTTEKLIFYAQDKARKNQNRLTISNTYGLLGQWALEAGDTAKAEHFVLLALTEMRQLDKTKYPALTLNYLAFSIYGDLAKYAEWRKDYKQAFEYTQMQMASQDSLLNAKTTAKIIKAENEFAKQKIIQENNFNKKAFYLTLAIAALAIISFSALILLYRLRLKQTIQHRKLLEAEAQNILNEKNKAILLANLEKERAERIAAEQLIIQQKNTLLQKEVMASSMQIMQKDELLQQVKEKLQTQSQTSNSADPFKEISRAIETHRVLDDDLAHYKERIATIHPDFFARLQTQANNRLTDIDLKYCVYIYMGVSTKNMATIMRVEITSIRMAKYRIKQKLNLDKDVELDGFVRGIV